MTLTAPTTPPPSLYFAPVGIAHLTDSVTDLVRHAAEGAQILRATSAAQLNGIPHLGTVTTLMSVFAFSAHASRDLGLPAEIVFDALENAAVEHHTIDGLEYTRTAGDLLAEQRPAQLEVQAAFRRLLDWIARRSGIGYAFRPYAEYQALAPVRECLHRIAADPDRYRRLVAPADGTIRIRPRCPQCHLVEKAAVHLTISSDDHAVHLESVCPHHGRYRETIPVEGTTGWYDANTPVRSVQKGYLLAAEARTLGACSVSIDGADWGGAWHGHVLAPALAELGIPARDWPVSVFAPMILDRSGGKLSKSLYLKYGADYADLPAAFTDLRVLLDQHGDAALDAIWAEVCRWAAEPRRWHRSYAVDHLSALVATHTLETAA
jgi:hypothetical protein